MLNGIYLNTAEALVEEIRQDVIANNLANIGTAGFKPDTAVFRARLREALEDPSESRFGEDALLGELGGGVFLDEVTYSRQNGALEPSSNPFDLGLDGDGFFVVAPGGTGGANAADDVGDSDGTRFYTRDGRFRRAPDGLLTTLDGRFSVLDRQGGTIRVPNGVFEVRGDGEVLVDGESLAFVEIAGSLDPERFEKVGAGVFRSVGGGDPPRATATVRQGFLERSAVGPVQEMVRLIHSHRAYEMNMQMIRMQDSTLARAVNDIGRLA